MAEGSGAVGVDPLFVGLTRPPMFLGVSYTYFIVEMMLGLMSFIITSNFQYLVMIVPVHFLGRYFCSKEPLFIELFMVNQQKCTRCINKIYHGANSYDPM